MNATSALGALALIVGMGLLHSAVAQPLFSGDVVTDGDFDAPDVVTLTNDLVSPETLTGMEKILADANQDALLNTDDTDKVVEVILGLSNPLPLGGEPPAGSATFWRTPLGPPPAGENDQRFVGAATFWRTPLGPPPAGEIDQRFLGAATFWRTPLGPRPAGEIDTRTLYAPTFWFQPPVPPAGNDDVVTLGAASFDRQ